MTHSSPTPIRTRWKLVVRWLLIPPALLLALLLTLYVWVLYLEHEAENRRQAALLAAFQDSFQSGIVQLVGVPTLRRVKEDFGLSDQVAVLADRLVRAVIPGHQGFGVSSPPTEYRIDATIKDSAGERRAAWKYWSRPSPSAIEQEFSGFCSAEAVTGMPETAGKVKWHFPTHQLIDGIPVTAGPTARIVKEIPPQDAEEGWQVIANVPSGTTASISFWPAAAVPTAATVSPPDVSGNVTWTFRTDPKFSGKRLQIRIDCVQPWGTRSFVSPTWSVRQIPQFPSAESTSSPLRRDDPTRR